MNYLRIEDVALIHFIIMKKFSEGERAGIKDLNVLRPAVQQSYPTIFEEAASLFESLARNHCFYNGNKRTAFASVDIFLKKNGYKLMRNDAENEYFTFVVAEGMATTQEIADWLGNSTDKYKG